MPDVETAVEAGTELAEGGSKLWSFVGGLFGEGVKAARQIDKTPAIIPLAMTAGAIWGIGSGIRGTARDLNDTLGNPVGFAATYGIHKTFGNERVVAPGVGSTFDTSSGNQSAFNNYNATGDIVLRSGK